MILASLRHANETSSSGLREGIVILGAIFTTDDHLLSDWQEPLQFLELKKTLLAEDSIVLSR